MSIQPMNDNILIEIDEETDQIATETGVKLFKPAGACEHVLNTGVVVATGKGRKFASGEVVPTGVQPGDGVLFIKFIAGYTETNKAIQHVVGKNMALIKPGDVLLVYDRKNPVKFTQ